MDNEKIEVKGRKHSERKQNKVCGVILKHHGYVT